MKQYSLSKHQQGASVTSVVLFIIALGLLGKLAVGVIPAYVGDYQLTKLVAKELKKANIAKRSEKQFLQDLNQQLSINANYDTKAEEVIVFTSKTPGALKVRLKYDSEYLYYGSTYIVNRFDKEVKEADAAGETVAE